MINYPLSKIIYLCSELINQFMHCKLPWIGSRINLCICMTDGVGIKDATGKKIFLTTKQKLQDKERKLSTDDTSLNYL